MKLLIHVKNKVCKKDLSMNNILVLYKATNVSALNVYSHISTGLYVWILCNTYYIALTTTSEESNCIHPLGIFTLNEL